MGYIWTRVETDQVISKIPCNISCIVITPDSSSNDADVTFYEGESSNDPMVFTLRSGAGVSGQWVFPVPLYMRRGFYVDIGKNVTEVLIQWETCKS